MRACYCDDGFYSITNFVPNSAITVDTVPQPNSVEDEVDEESEENEDAIEIGD